jgi:hypothetical protein
MSDGTIRDVLARLEEQEAELRALRHRLDGTVAPPRFRTRGPRPARRGWRWQRPAAALLLAFLLTTVPLGLLATDTWSDVPDSYVHHDDISLITDAGITFGLSSTTFGPDQFVTRGQMASFIARTAGLGSNPPVVNAQTAQTATNAEAVDGKSADELIRLAGESGDTVDLTDTYQDLVTVGITAPAPGFVQVTATLFAFGEAGCPCVVNFQLIDLTSGTPQPIFFTLDLEGWSEDSGGASFVFDVPAGSRTFGVQAKVEASEGSEPLVYSDADIVALYSPYGANGEAGTGGQGTTGPANVPNKRRPQR